MPRGRRGRSNRVKPKFTWSGSRLTANVGVAVVAAAICDTNDWTDVDEATLYRIVGNVWCTPTLVGGSSAGLKMAILKTTTDSVPPLAADLFSSNFGNRDYILWSEFVLSPQLDQSYRLGIDVKGRRKLNNNENIEFFATTNDAADGYVLSLDVRCLLRYN